MSFPVELRYWLALHNTPKLLCSTALKLALTYPNLADLFEQPNYFYEPLSLSKESVHSLQQPNWREVDANLDWLDSATDHHIIIQNSTDYPALLLEIADPPLLLFAQGDLRTLQNQHIAIVGSRKASYSGREIAYRLSKELCQLGVTVVSGLAQGIDTAAHQGALSGGQTLAVVGCGLDIIYPTTNRKLAHQIREQGAILSEFSIKTPPLPHHFPRRNRIISGLSLGTVVVEASLKSGSLITARLANDQGREVFAVPSSVNNAMARGCHALIKQGAKLVESVDDILEELPVDKTKISTPKPLLSPAKQNTLEEDHLKLLECVGYEPARIDDLVSRSGLSIPAITAFLVDLEMAGCICSTVSGYVRVM